MLYPLKFKPLFVEKIWGGRKIETVLKKPLPGGKQVGESWELYDFPPGVVEGVSYPYPACSSASAASSPTGASPASVPPPRGATKSASSSNALSA